MTLKLLFPNHLSNCMIYCKQRVVTMERGMNTITPDKILIVDDESEIRQLIRIHVEQAGMEAYEAESGQEAIMQLKGTPFSLMILDLMMDGRNGLDRKSTRLNS